MRHLKKFVEIFEGDKVSSDIFSPEFRREVNKELSPIKSEIKYYLNRGLKGHFDLVKIGDKTHPTLFLDGSNIPLVFSAFYVNNTGNLELVKNTSIPLEDQINKLLEKDLSSINAFLSSVGKNPIPKDFFLNSFKNDFYNGIRKEDGSQYMSKIISYVFGDYKDFIKKSKSTGEQITKEAVTNLPVFKEIEGIGGNDQTSERIWGNGNLKIIHPILLHTNWRGENLQDYITVYSGGPIRITSDGRPAIMTGAPGDIIANLQGWNDKLDYVLRYLLRKIAKEYFKITSTNELKKLSSGTVGDFFNSIIKDYSGEEFFQWLSRQNDKVQNFVLNSGIDLKDYIEKDPAKAAIQMKKVYSNPSLKKLLSRLDPETAKEFNQNLGLVGNLGDLGF
jgi:hypothetical protein